MRKLANVVLVCSLASGLLPVGRADSRSIQEEASDYGYSKELIDELPKHAKQQKRVSPQPFQPGPQGAPVEPSYPSADLNPRVYQAPEPSSLIPTLIRLHQKDPQSPKITRKLALTCLEADQPQEALHWFSMTWQRDHGDLAALWNLAALSWRLGDRQAARSFLQEYARLDPYSAWGKTARQMLEYEFLTDSSGNFDGTMPRLGISQSGTTASGGSLLVIDGRTTLPDSYSEPNRFPVDNPLKPKRKDDAEPSGKKSLLDRKNSSHAAPDAPKPNAPSKPTLEKAVIDAIPSASGTAPAAPPAQPPASPPASGTGTPPPPAK